ncbi:ralBP1-associated Eps domain-containing protein 1-like isoform X2 [Clavelina lepadiformis]|uniref:ralBP1-associated Eps domain-containing protein 1-like isoform X2 n=1 Tax=Clavelina lepadiformis TaxID=159417 RepID=UPI0040423541
MQSPSVKLMSNPNKQVTQDKFQTPRKPSQELPKNKGWTSFDESPVHLPMQGNVYTPTQSPWGGETPGGRLKNLAAKPDGDAEAGDLASHQSSMSPAIVSQRHLATHYPSATAQHTSRNNVPVPGQQLRGATPGKDHIAAPNSAKSSSSAPVVSSLSQNKPPQHPAPVADEHSHPQNIYSSSDDDEVANEDEMQDAWCITEEQRHYYMKQFLTMQKDVKGKIGGPTARNFFTKSKLPIIELSHIWELSDMDQDGQLTLDEFCTAFHLVVARKNGYDLPSQLPQALVPTLIDIVEAEQPTKVHEAKSSDQWETFSDRTSSSTTLANFDQVPDSTQENLHHPVALRLSPSRHKHHWVDVGDTSTPSKEQQEVLDEDSTTSSPQMHARERRPITNPYGYLHNELSEVESCGEVEHQERGHMEPSSSDLSDERNIESDEKFSKHNLPSAGSMHPHSSDADSASSGASSNRSSVSDSSGDDDWAKSDLEHSDWSSRPLRPRSASSSSSESVNGPATVVPTPLPAPTPPPRPNLTILPTPMPKPRKINARNVSNDNPEAQHKAPEPGIRLEKPMPPPRPQANASQEPQVVEQESFADFTAFNQAPEVKGPEVKLNEKSEAIPQDKGMKKSKSDVIPKQERPETQKPHKEPLEPAADISSTESEPKTHDQEKNAVVKKAPTKPPRTRIMSSDVCKPETFSTPLTMSQNDETKLPSAPKQDPSRKKSGLQTSIRELKSRNTKLMRLNADLQQQLKDVMEKRITVEMNIHQMRPFTQ